MTESEIQTACEQFLETWNRHDWMAEHGEWSDNGDHIEEGLLDPDRVSDDTEDLEVYSTWQGWDCHEGWRAYRVGSALYLNWWRAPYGRTARHERDLWVQVNDNFFTENE